MSVIALRCPSCLAPVDPERGVTQRCAYCGGALFVEGPIVGQPGTLRLEECGNNKISVIKVIREHTGLGLKESMQLAEGAPCDLAKWDDPMRLEKFRADLVEAGARTSGVAAMTLPFRSAPAGATTGRIFLDDCGPSKIMVIKAIREWIGVGLKDAKDLADSAPCVIGEGLDNARLAKLRDELVAAGARVR